MGDDVVRSSLGLGGDGVARVEGELLPSPEVRRLAFEAVPWRVACAVLSGDLVVRSVREGVDLARTFGALAESLGRREAEVSARASLAASGGGSVDAGEAKATLVDLQARIAERKRAAGI
jgi:hypothetical protein